MPPTTHVDVAAEQVPGVVDALLTTCAVAADALHHALSSYLDGTLSEGELHEHRRRLDECEDALDAIGWARGQRLEGVQLTGPPALLGDALTAAVLDAAEAVATTCQRYGAGRAELRDVQAAVTDLVAQQRLFAAHERQVGD
jgi:hypothetical protein